MSDSRNPETLAAQALSGTSLEVHRLLDEAFAGISMTPERQEIKEEIRANLVARVAELHAEGLGAEAAARRAMHDLGDLGELIGADAAEQVDGERRGVAVNLAQLQAQHRVRPRPEFIWQAVPLGVVGLAGIAASVVGATTYGATTLGWSSPVRVPPAIAAAVAVGALTALALRQETTANHPLPAARANSYGFATAVGVFGLGLASLYLPDLAVAWLLIGGLVALVGAAWLAGLVATQTNRSKGWATRLQNEQSAMGDRFTEDPASAARFGLYTVVVWLVAVVAFAALTRAVGWAFSWVAIVVAVAVQTLLLARMLFPPRS